MEWYKNKKAINSRALKNTCCTVCITFCPGRIHCRFNSHSLSIALRQRPGRLSRERRKKREAAEKWLSRFNGWMHLRPTVFGYGHRHHPPHFLLCSLPVVVVFRTIKLFFSATAYNIFARPIIVIIKVKYGSNLGWYSRSPLWCARFCRPDDMRVHNISRMSCSFCPAPFVFQYFQMR